jgi:hypothetical protein
MTLAAIFAVVLGTSTVYGSAESDAKAQRAAKKARLKKFACIVATTPAPLDLPHLYPVIWNEFRPAMIKSQLALIGFQEDVRAGQLWNKLEKKPGDVIDGRFEFEMGNAERSSQMLANAAIEAAEHMKKEMTEAIGGKSETERDAILKAKLEELKARKAAVVEQGNFDVERWNNAPGMNERLVSRALVFGADGKPEPVNEFDFKFLITLITRGAAQVMRSSILDGQIKAVEGLLYPSNYL